MGGWDLGEGLVVGDALALWVEVGVAVDDGLADGLDDVLGQLPGSPGIGRTGGHDDEVGEGDALDVGVDVAVEVAVEDAVEDGEVLPVGRIPSGTIPLGA